MKVVSATSNGRRQRPALAAALLLVTPPIALPSPIAHARRPHARSGRQAFVAPRGESPEERLARGRQAYLHSDFGATVNAVSDLLYPDVKLGSEEDVESAHRLLALAYLLSHDDNHAEAEFSTLLQLNPGFSLDVTSDPPPALAFLDRLKKREAERLDAIERRQREETERAQREASRKRDEEEARRAKELEARLRESLASEIEARLRRSFVPEVIEQHSLALAFAPFGLGQLQNGQREKAWALLGSQLALGVGSLSCWAALEAKYSAGLVPRAEWASAQTLSGLAIGAGALFWADVAFGIVDALVHYKPRVTRPGAAPATGAIAPSVSASGSGATFGLSGRF